MVGMGGNRAQPRRQHCATIATIGLSLGWQACFGWVRRRLAAITVPNFREPTANGLVGDVQASLPEHVLHIAKAQREPIIQPDRMADDIGRKAVALE